MFEAKCARRAAPTTVAPTTDTTVGTRVILEKPAPKEAKKSLNDRQRFAAEISYAGEVFKQLFADVRSDTRIGAQYIAGVLDALAVTSQTDPGAQERLEKNWGEKEGRVYLERATQITTALTAKREEIFKKAANWEPNEQLLVINNTVKTVNKALTKEGQNFLPFYLTHSTELPEEQIEKLPELTRRGNKNWRRTFGINTAMIAVPYGMGSAAEAFDVLNAAPLLEQIDNEAILTVSAGGSYVGLLVLLALNGIENQKLLQEKGISTVGPSKWAYEKFTASKDLAAWSAYSAYHAVSEAAFLAKAVEIYAESGLRDAALFLLTANAVALGAHFSLLASTRRWRKSHPEQGLFEGTSTPRRKRNLSPTQWAVPVFTEPVSQIESKI